jgi:hypothetical protein
MTSGTNFRLKTGEFFGAPTSSITTFSITTFNLIGLFKTLSIATLGVDVT